MANPFDIVEGKAKSENPFDIVERANRPSLLSRAGRTIKSDAAGTLANLAKLPFAVEPILPEPVKRGLLSGVDRLEQHQRDIAPPPAQGLAENVADVGGHLATFALPAGVGALAKVDKAGKAFGLGSKVLKGIGQGAEAAMVGNSTMDTYQREHDAGQDVPRSLASAGLSGATTATLMKALPMRNPREIATAVAGFPAIGAGERMAQNVINSNRPDLHQDPLDPKALLTDTGTGLFFGAISHGSTVRRANQQIKIIEDRLAGGDTLDKHELWILNDIAKGGSGENPAKRARSVLEGLNAPQPEPPEMVGPMPNYPLVPVGEAPFIRGGESFSPSFLLHPDLKPLDATSTLARRPHVALDAEAPPFESLGLSVRGIDANRLRLSQSFDLIGNQPVESPYRPNFTLTKMTSLRDREPVPTERSPRGHLNSVAPDGAVLYHQVPNEDAWLIRGDAYTPMSEARQRQRMQVANDIDLPSGRKRLDRYGDGFNLQGNSPLESPYKPNFVLREPPVEVLPPQPQKLLPAGRGLQITDDYGKQVPLAEDPNQRGLAPVPQAAPIKPVKGASNERKGKTAGNAQGYADDARQGDAHDVPAKGRQKGQVAPKVAGPLPSEAAPVTALPDKPAKGGKKGLAPKPSPQEVAAAIQEDRNAILRAQGSSPPANKPVAVETPPPKTEAVKADLPAAKKTQQASKSGLQGAISPKAMLPPASEKAEAKKRSSVASVNEAVLDPAKKESAPKKVASSGARKVYVDDDGKRIEPAVEPKIEPEIEPKKYDVIVRKKGETPTLVEAAKEAPTTKAAAKKDSPRVVSGVELGEIPNHKGEYEGDVNGVKVRLKANDPRNGFPAEYTYLSHMTGEPRWEKRFNKESIESAVSLEAKWLAKQRANGREPTQTFVGDKTVETAPPIVEKKAKAPKVKPIEEVVNTLGTEKAPNGETVFPMQRLRLKELVTEHGSLDDAIEKLGAKGVAKKLSLSSSDRLSIYRLAEGVTDLENKRMGVTSETPMDKGKPTIPQAVMPDVTEKLKQQKGSSPELSDLVKSLAESKSFARTRDIVHNIGQHIYETGMKFGEFNKALKSHVTELWGKAKDHAESAWRYAKKAHSESPLSNEEGFVRVPNVIGASKEKLKEIKDGAEHGWRQILTSTFYPAKGAPQESLNAVYKRKGQIDKQFAYIDLKMRDYLERASKWSEEEKLDYIQKVRDGQGDKLTGKTKELYDMMEPLGDMMWDRIVELDPDMAKYRKSHHALLTLQWINGEIPKPEDGNIWTPGSLEGTKAFLKKRSSMTFDQIQAEEAKLGRVLKSANPVEIHMQSLMNELKYVETGNYLKEGISSGRIKYLPDGIKIPEGYRAIPDKVADIYKKLLFKQGQEPFYLSSYDVKDESKPKLDKQGEPMVDKNGKPVYETVATFPHFKQAADYAIAHGLVGANGKPTIKAHPKTPVFEHAGKWIVPTAEARMIEHSLSKDYIRGNSISNQLMRFKNGWTAIELVSGFHYATITQEVISSRAGLALQQALRGDLKELGNTLNPANWRASVSLGHLAKEMLKDPEGFKANEKYMGQLRDWLGVDADKFAEYVNDYHNGGGRLFQDPELRFGKIRQKSFSMLTEGMEKGDAKTMLIGGVRVPVDMYNYAVRDMLFEKFVPNAKFADFVLQYQYDLKQFKDQLDSGAITKEQLAQRNVRSAENRFGEMNWENFWFNRTFKSALQVAFRSFSWQFGTWRAFGTAVQRMPQQAKYIKNALKGEKLIVDRDVAWLGTLLATHMMEAVIIGYSAAALTGDENLKPKQFVDYIFPKIGALTRISIPGYVKEPISLVESSKNDPFYLPTEYVMSKLSGMFGKAAEIYRNKDFYGDKIYDPDAPINERWADMAAHFVVKPFSLESWNREQQQGEGLTAAFMSGLGFNKAPGFVDKSPALRLAQRYISDSAEVGGRPAEQAEDRKLKREVIAHLRKGGTIDNLPPALSAALDKLNDERVKGILDQGESTQLQAAFKQIKHLPEALNVWNKMDEQEKKDNSELMYKKIMSYEKREGNNEERLKRMGKRYEPVLAEIDKLDMEEKPAVPILAEEDLG